MTEGDPIRIIPHRGVDDDNGTLGVFALRRLRGRCIGVASATYEIQCVDDQDAIDRATNFLKAHETVSSGKAIEG